LVSGKLGMSISKSPLTACICDFAEARFSNHSKVYTITKSIIRYPLYLSAADVSRGQHILELVREEELLKLIGDVDRSLRDVQVTDDQNEL
jgi:transcriptional regulator of NAD metabolism